MIERKVATMKTPVGIVRVGDTIKLNFIPNEVGGKTDKREIQKILISDMLYTSQPNARR